MFDFLNKVFEWIFQFVPQFVILAPSEEGIRVTCIPFIKSWVRPKKFGWYAYWPLFQSFHVINVKPQILVVEVVRDGINKKSIVSTWGVQFWVQNVEKALLESEDFEERLASHTAKVIGKYIEEDKIVDEKVLSEVRSAMSGLGIYIQEIFPLQYTTVKSLKLFMESATERKGRII